MSMIENSMKQKIKIGDLQRLLPLMQAFTRNRQLHYRTVSAKGFVGTLTFIKRLSRMRHDSDLSEWEPILKRRLIRMLHQLEGYNGHPGFLERLWLIEAADSVAFNRHMTLHDIVASIVPAARQILKRLADVDGVSGSLLKMPSP